MHDFYVLFRTAALMPDWLPSFLIGSIPSPSNGMLKIGPLTFRAYGICIALGVVAGISLAQRRLQARGGTAAQISSIATWAVPAGVIGARIYHVATDWKSYRGQWLDALKIWEGGLGIWGGVALGTIVGLMVARQKGVPLGHALDAAAPSIALAQAIGRWGNWFNVELFGRPTDLPWALEVPVAKRPIELKSFPTFHPAFLYESLWNLVVVIGGILLIERVLRRKNISWASGRMFPVYVALYTFGRFWIERIRVDKASKLLGLRVNEWTSAGLFLAAVVIFFAMGRSRRSSGQTAANPAQ